MSRLDKYTPEARQALTYAREEAQRLRHQVVDPEHILLGILNLQDPLIAVIFSSLHVSVARVCQALEFVTGRGNRAFPYEPSLGQAARATLAKATSAELIGVEHLLLGLFAERNGVTVGVLESFGLYVEAIRQQITMVLRRGCENIISSTQYQAQHDATPTLNLVSRDLTATALAGTLDPMIGREVELERTMQILSRRSTDDRSDVATARGARV